MTVTEHESAAAPVAERLEEHRTELTGYCYRMLGSAFEAEDAVQTTFIQAWRGYDRFEGRSTLRTWLYRIATNVCFDMLRGKERRFRPMDFGPASSHETALDTGRPEATWITPIPDGRVFALDGDPAELAVARDSVRLAFITALQHLPPRQRAVLILREVLRWKASEVAELLDGTVASVNSALQRARATLTAEGVADSEVVAPLDPDQRDLLDRYVAAFEAYDIDGLLQLIHEDATQSMPPYELWLQGKDDIIGWLLGTGAGCRNSRLVPTVANGSPAFGQYKPDPAGGHGPWALVVLGIDQGKIAELAYFLDTSRLFPLFGLPPRLDAEPAPAT
jgi:RNA polymerase sigma-70 factor (ECF subfamily)